MTVTACCQSTCCGTDAHDAVCQSTYCLDTKQHQNLCLGAVFPQMYNIAGGALCKDLLACQACIFFAEARALQTACTAEFLTFCSVSSTGALFSWAVGTAETISLLQLLCCCCCCCNPVTNKYVSCMCNLAESFIHFQAFNSQHEASLGVCANHHIVESLLTFRAHCIVCSTSPRN